MHAETALHTALEHHRAGRIDEAIAIYQAILEADDNHAGAWLNLGAARRQQGDTDGAIAALHRAAELAPDHPGVRFNLGNALADGGDLGGAETQFRLATQSDPAFADAFNNWGDVLMRRGREEDALEVFTLGLRVAPDHPGLLANRGNVEHRLDMPEAAIAHLRRALEMAPDDTRAWRNLGNVLRTRGRLAEAAETLRAGLARDPEDAEAHCLLAFTLLAAGEYGAGWPEYAWRWRSAEHEPARPFSWPAWDGGDPAGKRLLVWGEQAVGDEVMFATMLPELIAAGADIVLETEYRLQPLFARSFPELRVIERRTPPAPEITTGRFDAQVALGDLGRHLRRGDEDFAASAPYLRADAVKTAEFRAAYADPAGGRRRVGLAWRSGAEQAGVARSVPLAEFGPVLERPACWFVNLQYGDAAAELEAAGVHVHTDPAVDQLADMDTFAAQVASLDLVITTANTTAHVAAALGVETWVLLGPTPDWRWRRAGETSPWYPAARLFRCPDGGGWRDAVGAVTAALDATP